MGAVTVLGAATVAYAPPAPAADPADGYAFVDGARRVSAAENSTGAERLELGAAYRSGIARGGQAYFRIALDAASDAYVAVTAVPPPGTEVSVLDGLKVSVQDVDGGVCDQDTETFGSVRSARPLTAWSMRELTPRRTRCQNAGTYYVVVESVRAQSSGAASLEEGGTSGAGAPGTEDWELELVTVSEPALSRGEATEAPDSWNSATPTPLTGEPESVAGGAGFTRATRLGQGVWQDAIRPGQTLFYAVPLGWGQQLYADVELGSSPDGSGATAGALDLTLYNPARGPVDHERAGYYGRQQSAELDPLPPVAHANRYAVTSKVKGMRFAGSYYLAVHLADQVAERFGDGPLGLTLRVRVTGAAGPGPDYAGEPVPKGVFGSAGSLPGGSARGGGSAAGRGGADGPMTALAVGGIGVGTTLVLGLAVWTLVARRRAAE